jgi:hypothetical protein
LGDLILFQNIHAVQILNRYRGRHFVVSDFLYDKISNSLRLFFGSETIIARQCRYAWLVYQQLPIHKNIVPEGFICRRYYLCGYFGVGVGIAFFFLLNCLLFCFFFAAGFFRKN